MNLKFLTSALFSTLLVFAACDKNDDTAGNPNPDDTDKPVQPKEAPMKAKVDTVNWEAATTSVGISGGLFTLTGFGKNGHDIGIRTFDVNRTGIYTSGSISYEIHSGGGNFKQWSAILSDSGNTLIVTKYDSINKKISGTFSCKTNKFQGSVADTTHKTITNGVFNDIKLP